MEGTDVRVTWTGAFRLLKCSSLGRADLVLAGDGNDGSGGASERAGTGTNPMEGPVQWKELTFDCC